MSRRVRRKLNSTGPELIATTMLNEFSTYPTGQYPPSYTVYLCWFALRITSLQQPKYTFPLNAGKPRKTPGGGGGKSLLLLHLCLGIIHAEHSGCTVPLACYVNNSEYEWTVPFKRVPDLPLGPTCRLYICSLVGFGNYSPAGFL
jgi:hypothetical protein